MKINVLLLFLLYSMSMNAQVPDLKGYKRLDESLFVKRVKKGRGKRIRKGDYVYLRTQLFTADDSLVFDSDNFHVGPVEIRLNTESSGPLEKGLFTLRGGDSAVIFFPATRMYDSIVPDFVRSGLWMKYRIRVFRALDSITRSREYEMRKKRQLHLEDSLIVSFMMQHEMRSPFRTPSGVMIQWHSHGRGIVPDTGDYISLHYRGKLMNGEVFDDSYSRKEPFRYVVGRQRLIPGWEDAISYLAEGDSATVFIPSPLGYGENGSGWSIPPDAVLVFDMKILETSNAAYQLGRDTLAIRKFIRQHGRHAKVYDNGVAVIMEKEGSGPALKTGALVTLQMRARLLSGQVVEDHWRQAKTFRLNTGHLLPGLEFALEGMRVGSEVEILLPSGLAYGPAGRGKIPSDAVLIYEIKILESR